MSRRTIASLVGLVAALALGAFACGGDDATPKPATASATATSTPGQTVSPTAAAGGAVDVQLSDFVILPSPSTVPAGPVAFNATNAGQVEHEFVVVKTDLSPNALPVDAAGDVDEAKLDSPGEIEGIAVGQTRSKTFDLVSGNYVLICNEPGHYKQGMFVAFQVK